MAGWSSRPTTASTLGRRCGRATAPRPARCWSRTSDAFTASRVCPVNVRLATLTGALYFSGNDGVSGWELWKSDGTDAGTTLVKDIYSGNAGSVIGSLANVNRTLFFSA